MGYGLSKQKQWKCTKCREVTIEAGGLTPVLDNDTALAEINSKLDLILQKNEDTTNEVANLREMVTDLTKEIKKRDDTIKKLTEKIEILDQYSRNKNIEICNIPKVENENLKKIVLKLADKMEVGVKEDDIEVVHRLPSKGNKIQPIIIQFQSRQVRDRMLNRKKKIITTSELIGQGNGKVFINPNLNKYFRELRYKAKQLGNELGYKYIWFKNNKILAKKNEFSKDVIIITNEDDLEKMKKNETASMSRISSKDNASFEIQQ